MDKVGIEAFPRNISELSSSRYRRLRKLELDGRVHWSGPSHRRANAAAWDSVRLSFKFSTPRVSALLSLCFALDALKSDIYFISMISCRSRFEEVKSRNSNSAVDPTSWGTGGVLVELSSFFGELLSSSIFKEIGIYSLAMDD